jgi:monoamine oxidase
VVTKPFSSEDRFGVSLVDENQTDVVVIGAGAAGLAAAGRLAVAGRSVTILEARDRIGGRIDTTHDPDWPIPIERGAEFLHGVVPDVWDLFHEHNITPYECHQEHWHLRGKKLRRLDMWKEADRVLAKFPKRLRTDLSFDEFVKKNRSKLPRGASLRLAYLYIQGLNAAHARSISVESLVAGAKEEEKIEAQRLFRPLQGFDQLVGALSAVAQRHGARIRLGEVVEHVAWSREGVAVTTDDAVYRARHVVVTLPLGVLQAAPGSRGAVRFDPAIPGKIAQARRLAMGPVVKVALRFTEPFWETLSLPTVPKGKTLRDMGFLFGDQLRVPVWWTYLPLRTRVLMGWAGGPHAEALSDLDEREILRAALESLSKLLGLSVADLRRRLQAHKVSQWQTDPFSRGAYSYVPVGALDAVKRLARPIDGTLFFAGEATQYQGMSATVAGAIQTGWRAADEILAQRR